MRPIAPVLALGICIACGGLSKVQTPKLSHSQTRIGCRSSVGFADDFRSYVVEVAMGTDTESAELRTGWDIPRVSDPTQVSFVPDSIACDKAARAHAVAAQQDTLHPYPVWLLEVGKSRFIAFNGAKTGEFLTYFVFDQKFKLVSAIAS